MVSFKGKLRKVSGRVPKDSNPFLGPMLTTRGWLQNPYLAPLLPCRSNTEHRRGEKAGFKGPPRDVSADKGDAATPSPPPPELYPEEPHSGRRDLTSQLSSDLHMYVHT